MPKDKHIRIRTERRPEPDVRKLSRALLALAQAQAEKEAEEADQSKKGKPGSSAPRRSA